MGALRPESRDALLGLSIQDGTLLGATLSTVGGNCPLRICALKATNLRRLHQDPAFQARQVDRQQLRSCTGFMVFSIMSSLRGCLTFGAIVAC